MAPTKPSLYICIVLLCPEWTQEQIVWLNNKDYWIEVYEAQGQWKAFMAKDFSCLLVFPATSKISKKLPEIVEPAQLKLIVVQNGI